MCTLNFQVVLHLYILFVLGSSALVVQCDHIQIIYFHCLEMYTVASKYLLYICNSKWERCNKPLYSVQSTPYRVHRTEYTVQSTPYRVHRTEYTVQSTPYRVHRTVNTVQSTPYSEQCTDIPNVKDIIRCQFFVNYNCLYVLTVYKVLNVHTYSPIEW